MSGVIGLITESASRVKTLVDEVNVGSQEQTRGINQISQAVSRMSQVTQGTAASAEEGAAAGEELSAQVGALNEIVLRLRALVGGDGLMSTDGAPSVAKVERRPTQTGNVSRTSVKTPVPSEGAFIEF